MLLLHNGRILREAGFLAKEAVATGSNGAALWGGGRRELSASMKVVFMYRDLLPSLRSWMRIEDGYEGQANEARICGAIRQVQLENLDASPPRSLTYELSPAFLPVPSPCLLPPDAVSHETSSSTTWWNVYERSWDVSCCTHSSVC
jgi:hypothetical protein